MKPPFTRRATQLILFAGLLLGSQLAALSGVKFPNAEPVMGVRTEGELAFRVGEPGKLNSVIYAIIQTDIDTLQPGQTTYDPTCKARSLVTRSMEPHPQSPSKRGVNAKYETIWDVVGRARSAPGIYRDSWEVYNDCPPLDPTYDPPLRVIRVVELKAADAPRPNKVTPIEAVIEGEAPPPDPGEDDKLSTELRKRLTGLLTADEEAQFKAGEEVEVSFERLSPELRKGAERYAELRWAAGWGPLDGKIALRREAGLKLWISPTESERIGVNGKLTDGRSVFF